VTEMLGMVHRFGDDGGVPQPTARSPLGNVRYARFIEFEWYVVCIDTPTIHRT
jgi:hypothetical protein